MRNYVKPLEPPARTGWEWLMVGLGEQVRGQRGRGEERTR